MSNQLFGGDRSPLATQPEFVPRFGYDRSTRLAGAAVATSIAIAVSVVGLALNELTDQSLVVFRAIVFAGPISVSPLGYALTPALLARRRVVGLNAIWAMTLGTLASGVVLVAAFTSFTGLPEGASWPLEPLMWTVALSLAGLVYTGIPMLVLILPCAMIWERLTRRLVTAARSRAASDLAE